MHRSAKTPIITPWNSVPFIDFPFTINATCDRAIAAFCAAAISSAEADSAASSASGSAHVASADSPILLHLGHFSSSLASGVPHAGQVHSDPFFCMS